MISSFPGFIFVDDNSLVRDNVSNILRSSMEVGPQKTRPIQSTPLFNLTMSVSICEKDLLLFRQWFNGETNFGSNWFMMNDPFDGTRRRFRFLDPEFSWRKNGDVLTTSFILEAYDEL